ncbi:MAG: hypothetical protein OEY38_16495 [Gammaproteobacteria bacterium]|nr:hypothetical protein [Gammaproteobacteria bacterium]
MKKVINLLLLFVFFVITSFNTHAGVFVRSVSIVDLGVLPGGNNSFASDINDGGYIVGRSEVEPGVYHAFRIGGLGMHDLGTLPGGSSSAATAVANNGLIVGYATTSSGVTHAVSMDGTSIRDLGAFPPEHESGSFSQATAVTKEGLVLGIVNMDYSVIWDLNATPVYPPYPPFTRIGDGFADYAYDMNVFGHAVGHSTFEDLGFIWRDDYLFYLVKLSPTAPDDTAFGINAQDVIVGRSQMPSLTEHHAVIWFNRTVIQDLGTLGGLNSTATDINQRDMVVGHSETASGNTEAFIWHKDFGMYALGTLDGNNSWATAINERGQVVGSSTTASGATHATLWNISFGFTFDMLSMDILPESVTNFVDVFDEGAEATVVLLSSPEFKPIEEVDTDSVTFGAKRASPKTFYLKDYNQDGIGDIAYIFNIVQSGIACGDLKAILYGKTRKGSYFEAVDVVQTECSLQQEQK